jgi:hypothetical protein
MTYAEIACPQTRLNRKQRLRAKITKNKRHFTILIIIGVSSIL